MISAALAQKLGMTQIYDEKNRHIPVTILRVPLQAVTAIRTQDKDNYSAFQLGAVTRKHVAKPQQSELTAHNITVPLSSRKEIRVREGDAPAVGEAVSVTVFTPGDTITITGKSKGKGFAGGIKRHGWSRGPMSHGSKHHRAPGSIGSGYPQRVVPGKKLPGHLGHETVTVKGCTVIAINEVDNTLAVSGPVPGANKSFVLIQKREK